jgi:hypothetical protein
VCAVYLVYAAITLACLLLLASVGTTWSKKCKKA